MDMGLHSPQNAPNPVSGRRCPGSPRCSASVPPRCARNSEADAVGASRSRGCASRERISAVRANPTIGFRSGNGRHQWPAGEAERTTGRRNDLQRIADRRRVPFARTSRLFGSGSWASCVSGRVCGEWVPLYGKPSRPQALFAHQYASVKSSAFPRAAVSRMIDTNRPEESNELHGQPFRNSRRDQAVMESSTRRS